MSGAHRDKIRNSNILNALIEHVEGKRDMAPSQVTAGVALLRKVLPDLTAVEHSGEVAQSFIARMPEPETDATAWQKRYSNPPIQ